MIKDKMGTMRRRLGPLGLSLVAAALTATAFAGVSVAQKNDSGNGSGQNRNGDAQRVPGPGAGGPPAIGSLSEEDQQALEEFRQCMEDNGAPAPPEPPAQGSKRNGTPPDPPSEADREAMEKAHEACQDKLPEGAQAFPGGPGGPGGHGGPPCGPPPNGTPRGTAPNQGDSGDNQAAPQGSSSSSAS